MAVLLDNHCLSAAASPDAADTTTAAPAAVGWTLVLSQGDKSKVLGVPVPSIVLWRLRTRGGLGGGQGTLVLPPLIRGGHSCLWLRLPAAHSAWPAFRLHLGFVFGSLFF